MKYFLDTEFLEGTQRTLFGKTKPTIDLISIGIVAEDGREYYAISKEFNLKEAWNRWQQRTGEGDRNNTEPRLYWLRDNVLKPIWEEKCNEGFTLKDSPMTPYGIETLFTYKNFKKLINKYGKTNKQIAEEIKLFTKVATQDQLEYKGVIENYYTWQFRYSDLKWEVYCGDYKNKEEAYNEILKVTENGKPDDVEFYAYYADYDWVVFCWLFGKMKDLPKGFPYYCRDLQQELDRLEDKYANQLMDIPRDNYPKQTNEHNALADARWNFELYKFLNTL
jgi:hypothetical protein